MTTMTAETTQVYNVYIRATPEQIWNAITKPEFTERYFHGVRIAVADGVRTSDLGDLHWEEPVLEEAPPRRLVHGWRSHYDEEMAAEEQSRVTWEIEPHEGGYSLLTVTHDRLEGAPKTAAGVAGTGWMGVLSNLKSFLETGEALF
ncbi:MAG TPA: SRPBCC domain-containing protein [Gaiellaceae bacterium]|nr:SRPBCC domain-containing protein [Gaiellaceae bacterium]